MDKFLVDRIQVTIDNYRLAKEELKKLEEILNQQQQSCHLSGGIP